MWWNFIWSITESLDCQQFQRSNAKRMLYPHVFYIWNSYRFVPVFQHRMALNSRGLHISCYLHVSNTEGILPSPVDRHPSFHFSRWLHIILSKDVQVVNLSLLSPDIWQKDYISGWKLGNCSYKPVFPWVTSLTSYALVFAKDKMEGIKFPSHSRRSNENFCSLCDERQSHNFNWVLDTAQDPGPGLAQQSAHKDKIFHSCPWTTTDLVPKDWSKIKCWEREKKQGQILKVISRN